MIKKIEYSIYIIWIAPYKRILLNKYVHRGKIDHHLRNNSINSILRIFQILLGYVVLCGYEDNC